MSKRCTIQKKPITLSETAELGCCAEEHVENLAQKDIQSDLQKLIAANQALQEEIVRRQAVEEHLRLSEQQTHQLIEELRLLSHRVLTVQEEERKRISRELHDEITQTLIGINVHLETLSRATNGDPKELQREIDQTQKLVENSVGIVHRFAQQLRPTVLDDLGLIPALHDLMKNFMKKTGIRVALKVFRDIEELSIDKRITLYRVVQEALTNIFRHAHACRVEVTIIQHLDIIHMQVKDNGCSFEVAQILSIGADRRLGLLGMRERTEMVGGRFEIESAPDRGTAINVYIPFTNETQEKSTL